MNITWKQLKEMVDAKLKEQGRDENIAIEYFDFYGGQPSGVETNGAAKLGRPPARPRTTSISIASASAPWCSPRRGGMSELAQAQVRWLDDLGTQMVLNSTPSEALVPSP